MPTVDDEEYIEEDIIFEDTDFDSWDDWDAPAGSTGPNIKFIPFDTPPKPKNSIFPIYPEIAKEAGISQISHIDKHLKKKL